MLVLKYRITYYLSQAGEKEQQVIVKLQEEKLQATQDAEQKTTEKLQVRINTIFFLIEALGA